jgi:hypothetical protein
VEVGHLRARQDMATAAESADDRALLARLDQALAVARRLICPALSSTLRPGLPWRSKLPGGRSGGRRRGSRVRQLGRARDSRRSSRSLSLRVMSATSSRYELLSVAICRAYPRNVPLRHA